MRAVLDGPRVVRYNTHMREELRTRYLEAVEMAQATLGDVARGSGRAERTVHAYKAGDRDVTPEAARALATYLRARGWKLHEMAARLEAAAMKAHEGGDR